MRGLALVLATAGGVGYSPVASGTLGTLVGLPLVVALAPLWARSPALYLLAVAAVIVVAIWSAGGADVALGEHDSGKIVIDEVAGMVVAGAFLPAGWLALAAGFVLFRVFDIVKPYPAGYFDRDVGGGFGVVADDLVAGAYAGVVARVGLALLGGS